MSATVVVVGGGYAGIAVARELDAVADVVLVEPRESFFHNVAALRGLVDPAWTDRLFYPYDHLLTRGRVVRDRAVEVDPTGVALASGDRIAADYVVLATGSTYPFPAKSAETGTTAAKARIRATREALTGAEHVLLLGAGPVGLELAGELKAAWPDKRVTILDPAEDLLPDFPPEFRAELRNQLADLEVDLLLGSPLREKPPTTPGERAEFTAIAHDDRKITADIWFRCFGVQPNSDYLSPELAKHRNPDGAIQVQPDLRLPGVENVFAIGDVTAIPEPKMARAAGDHATTAAENIKSLLQNQRTQNTYAAAPPAIALPLGPTGGASYTAETGVLDATTTSQIKGQTLTTETYDALLLHQESPNS
ncbi:FAD-dependent oxidoreductase [Saccharopolyspora indica]|uniref:NAD(P)/FAD-dependent oxidoreductase n=1 Tax=Saccharopolyspora indica TaxID=1229659 RepID=UPI0022EAA7CE|nr:FAD-dependent oxidoreductase [Saccharopolyspora indica]MDA3646267.1 FAD-dependent oxidoreductase [Saccharopolyspora indica]